MAPQGTISRGSSQRNERELCLGTWPHPGDHLTQQFTKNERGLCLGTCSQGGLVAAGGELLVVDLFERNMCLDDRLRVMTRVVHGLQVMCHQEVSWPKAGSTNCGGVTSATKRRTYHRRTPVRVHKDHAMSDRDESWSKTSSTKCNGSQLCYGLTPLAHSIPLTPRRCGYFPLTPI